MKAKEILDDNIELKASHLMIFVFILGLSVGFAGGTAINGFNTAAPTATADQADNTQETQAAPSKVDLSKIDLEGEPTMGSEDAEVTIVEYTDYQCPFCRRHGTSTFPQIKENYIDTGKVRYVVKDFPVPQLGHDNAVKLAEAANCAQEQGMYWEAHDKLFNEQDQIAPRSTAKFDAALIDDWMEEIGLNMTQYDACMAEDSQEVNQDKQEGLSFEAKVNGRSFISGTPSFVIYGEEDSKGEPVIGAQPYSLFKSRIDAELNE